MRLGARAVRLGLDQLYPPTCLACQAPTERSDVLCAVCFVDLRPISAPLCPRLGLPFHTDPGEGALSAEAIADPPPFERARAAVLYSDVAGALVSMLKYGDRPEVAEFCARLMADSGREFWSERPVLVPVPLHPLRQFQRRYNQSAELTRALSALTGTAHVPGLLRRSRRTRQQVGLSRDARQRNVSGAFAPHRDLLAKLAGRPVVLVDDVYTTGATLKSATRALKRAGADTVNVLTFARVVSDAEIPI
ncbi:amidophosphoribosyltransferase [Devosia pacifica]|uniref:Amidophosphoribosyltransferase n=2 Tax=Devosia pacifica TaxID=1335967 RepID=A0A918S6C9_9HYPH|nr:amidophosphoribosyltransferase [Devosia pacifica]